MWVMPLHELMFHNILSSCRCLFVRERVCAPSSKRLSLGIPVSLKTPELNKRRTEPSEQETGSQLNLTWIHQSEKWRGVKNVTFHPPLGGFGL